MNVSFFNFIVIFFFVMSPVLAMEDEEAPKYIQAILPQQKAAEEDAFTLSIVPIENLPDELLLTVFKFLEIPDLGRVTQVSKHFQKLAEDSDVWKHTGLKYYGDYLSEEDLKENPKQKVISHYLSVVVNATEDLKEIERFISFYQLNLYAPLFKKYLGPNFLVDLVTNLLHFDEFIAQGNQELIERKIEGLSYGRYGYEKNRKAAREFIDSLVEKGNLVAIKKKTFMLGYRGCIDSQIGYETDLQAQEELDQLLIKKGDLKFTHTKIELLSHRHFDKLSLQAARELNDFLVEKGDSKAIKRKIEKGLCYGEYGYKKDLEAARELNDFLVEQGDPEAIERKIVALSDAGTHPLPFRGWCVVYWGVNVPDCGYKKDPSAARRFNDFLVNKGNPKATEIKIKGLLGIATGSFSNPEGCFTVNLTYGYEKDPVAAKELNELLIEQGDQEAIKRKIEGLSYGQYGYEKNPVAAKELNELLIEQGDQEAIKRKIEGLERGAFGYEEDPVAAKELNELLVEQGDPEAIKRKIHGFISGHYRYEKDPVAAREFIESLVISEVPVARGIGKYLKAFAMKYGISKLGYERSRQKAIKFIRKNHVPY